MTGMSCAACQARVEKAVGRVPGVTGCAVSLLTNSMGVEGTAAPADIIKAVENAGYGASLQGDPAGASSGMSANSSAQDAASNASQNTFSDAAQDSLADRETPVMKRRLISSAGFLLILMYFSMGVSMWGWPAPALFHNHVAVGVLEMLLALIVMSINRKFFLQGFGAVLHGGTNMDTLVALGSSAAFVYSLVSLFLMIWYMGLGDREQVMYYAMHHLYFESAAMIPTLITVGKMLESMSKGRTTDALKSLMRLAPKEATVLRDGLEVVVSIGEVAVGDTFVVKPGENIPVDGVIIEGHTAVNESALTGESVPVDKAEGDGVSAATINQSGYIRCTATRVGEDTTLSQIIKMVYDAAATKAPIARIADRVSAVFVPSVIALSLATILIWIFMGKDPGWAIARGISVLVISCPCALGLATPVAIMVGSGVGAKNGILYKTASSLEAIGRVDTIALDKTGTITSGAPVVTDVIPVDGCTGDELLELAYALEQRSEHPLAKSIVAYAHEHSVASREVTDFTALPGNGLTARLGDITLLGGSARFISGKVAVSDTLKTQSEQLASEGKTPLFFAADMSSQDPHGDKAVDVSSDSAPRLEDGSPAASSDLTLSFEADSPAVSDSVSRVDSAASAASAPAMRLLGIIAVADTIKDDSAAAISELKGMGINVVMLTGDNERTAAAIGSQAGVDQVIAGVLPDGKEAVIRRLQSDGSKVAMVGDGINDAPALTRADVGVAIGAGADVAIDAADIVLMKSRLSDVSASVRLSRATIRNIHQNLFWAFFYNALCIPLAMGVYGVAMKPMYGAAAMACSSFFVCMNALRLNLLDIRDSNRDKKLKRRLSKPQSASATSASAAHMDSPEEDPRTNDSHKENPSKKALHNENLSKKALHNEHLSKENSRKENPHREALRKEDMNKKDSQERKGDIMSKTVCITGMMCPHCEARVKKALEGIDGVSAAEVSHEKGTAVIETAAAVADDVIIKAVTDAGYEVTKVE